MAHPKRYTWRTKQLATGQEAFYLRFTDQHGKRQEPLVGYDLTEGMRERFRRKVQVAVDEGYYTPAELGREAAAAVVSPDVTMHVYASRWLARKLAQELSPKTTEWYEWGFKHLLRSRPRGEAGPMLAEYQLGELDYEVIEGVRDYLLGLRAERAERGKRKGQRLLGAKQVNVIMGMLKTLLGQAHRRGLIEQNWADGEEARTHVPPRDPVGTWLEYDQLVALFEAAHWIDRHGPRADTRNRGRRALLATLYLGGLRVTELCHLRRGDVNWRRGTIRVHTDYGSRLMASDEYREATLKTEAGWRYLTMHALLWQLLSEWWLAHPDPRPEALLFPNSRGNPDNKDNINNRVIRPALKKARELLVERDSDVAMPTRLSSHSGRRTAITWWAEAGKPLRNVMSWVGHNNPALTIKVYEQATNRPPDPRVIKAMADVPQKRKRAPRHLRAA